MSRVTLDTNIYVSAFEFGGAPMRLLQMGIDGEIEIAVSQPIIEETMRVLEQKFGWANSDLREALLVMESLGRKVVPVERLTVVVDDPDDDKVLECAVAAEADFLLTGDRHLLRLGSYRQTKIIKPAQFLAQGPE